MFVKPATGLVIPDPDRGGVLPAEGRDVPPTEFWRRRLRDGERLRNERARHRHVHHPGGRTLPSRPRLRHRSGATAR